MKQLLLGCTLVALLLGCYAEQNADMEYLPPDPVTKDLASTRAFSEEQLLTWIAMPNPWHFFGGPGAKRVGVAEQQKEISLCVGQVHPVDLDPQVIFGEGLADNGLFRFFASFTSVGAGGISVQADLTGLAADDQLWLIAHEGMDVLGPYSARDGVRWLPSVSGENISLMITSPRQERPSLTINALGHFYTALSKQIDEVCPVRAACAEEEIWQQLASAVGMLFIYDDLYIYQCSGTLLNNADTPAREPYMITAQHCFDTMEPITGIEVIWDYREETCTEQERLNFNTLPRSYGATMLVENTFFDTALIELEEEVPNGKFGRAWAGWTTKLMKKGLSATSIHHPNWTSMKTSWGAVVDTDTLVMILGGLKIKTNQAKLSWTFGLTEGGSSGSGLFVPDYNYRLTGVLSSGLFQSCTTEKRIDYFGSFAYFFPQIRDYLQVRIP